MLFFRSFSNSTLFSLLSKYPPLKESWPLLKTNLIALFQGCYLPLLVEICLVVKEKTFSLNFCLAFPLLQFLKDSTFLLCIAFTHYSFIVSLPCVQHALIMSTVPSSCVYRSVIHSATFVLSIHNHLPTHSTFCMRSAVVRRLVTVLTSLTFENSMLKYYLKNMKTNLRICSKATEYY